MSADDSAASCMLRCIVRHPLYDCVEVLAFCGALLGSLNSSKERKRRDGLPKSTESKDSADECLLIDTRNNLGPGLVP